MQSGLLLTHYSLLAIAIISSCCLFYLVASENAKIAANAQTHRRGEAADVSMPLPPFERVDAAAVASAMGETSKHASVYQSDNIKIQQVLRDYKKVKKTKSIREKDTLSSSIASDIFINKEKSDVSIKTDLSSASKVVLKPSATSISDNDAYKIESLKSVDSPSVVNSDNSLNRDDDSVQIEMSVGEINGASKTTHLDTESHESNNLRHKSLPNIITDIPSVTVTELPLEVLQPMQSSLNAIIMDASNKKTNAEDVENRTVDILEDKEKLAQQGDEIVKINDSGGGASDIDTADLAASKIATIISTSDSSTNQVSSEIETATVPTTTQPAIPESLQQITESTTAENSVAVNLTNEEVPMPVFSEWAQKQMEAAEKQQQAKEQEVVNTIAQKKNLTNGSKKLPPLKMRAKNYASPDCGAKIIASNSDATNTGAVLSSSKDEYMLSPCGNRIWFVVELCEAIQAQKVDLANFELFSSSPKNFTVAVSNRFPTRDWSNVGRFVAEDKRNVQSFDLHPHLFGKFVRLDIHSHHSQEHFCPVSLFRVFGTSEIEAFETENHPDDDLDDFEDELYGGGTIEQANIKNADNIFKSASDAVLSIVKKAAEVLVKPSNYQNRSLNVNTNPVARQLCRSFAYGEFSCSECAPNLVERINNLLSCEFHHLEKLLASERLRSDLLNTQICTKQFGVDTKALNNDCSLFQIHPLESDIKRSYYINLLPEEYIGALCYTLSGSTITGSGHITLANDEDNEIALNLTIDKKLKASDFDDVGAEKKVTQPKDKDSINIEKKNISKESDRIVQVTTDIPFSEVTTDKNVAETEQIVSPPEIKSQIESTTTPSTQENDPSTSEPTIAPDVNIFNIQQKDTKTENTEMPSTIKTDVENDAEEAITEPTPTISIESLPRSDEDAGVNIAWDNLDTLLPTTMSPGSNIGGSHSHQKIPGGPQSESIFIRLSNRIKTLERNMSLSGQYLEELSRRYKKQVEELQQVLTQQSQTVRSLEEQNRRHLELQELYEQGNILLKNELDNMALQVHACIIVIIVVGGFVLLLLVMSILFVRAIWYRNKAMQTTNENRKNNSTSNLKKLSRRKSFDEYSDHCTEKIRRPSEEVVDILKKHLEVPDKHKIAVDKVIQTQPQRKISVCYGSNPNQHIISQENVSKSKNSAKRKNAKNSWSNPNDTRQMALEHLESMRGMDVTFEEYKQRLEAEKFQKDKSKIQPTNGIGKSKKKIQNFRRQESAPTQCVSGNEKSANTLLSNEYSENLILDEEDLDNFIPNSDLAYNEFMPEGPSGYQILSDGNESVGLNGTENEKGSDKAGKKKLRRISSPGFFKTSLTKALKGKSLATGNVNAPINSKTPHSSATSWEWHRLKNADLSKSSPSSIELLRGSPTGSLDASTLSEIHFPTNSKENSFRILEEAILSSGETIDRSPTAATSNGKQSHSATSSISGGSGGSNSSQRSSISNSTSSSTTTKKKQRGFQRIFRKVF